MFLWQHCIFIKFFRFRSNFLAFFRWYFVLPNFWSLRNLIKQLFHLQLLDTRLVIAKSALRASLALYHIISNARSWNNRPFCRYGGHFDFYCFERHYGMLRAQINMYLPPGHPIIAIRNNRNQNGRRFGKKVYCGSCDSLPYPFSFPDPIVSLSRRGLRTRKRRVLETYDL